MNGKIMFNGKELKNEEQLCNTGLKYDDTVELVEVIEQQPVEEEGD